MMMMMMMMMIITIIMMMIIINIIVIILIIILYLNIYLVIFNTYIKLYVDNNQIYKFMFYVYATKQIPLTCYQV